MNGLRFDFEDNDLTLNAKGSFVASNIDSQNCALIAVSEVCRLTRPAVGERLGMKLVNRRNRNVSVDIARAVRAVEADGGRNVSITLNREQQLQFIATYD